MASLAEDTVSLVLRDWGLGSAQRVGHREGWGWRRTLWSLSCSHPFDQFGIGYGESLNAFKVSLLSLKPLSSCNDIEKPVPFALHGLVKEVRQLRQVEFKVMSVSQRQGPGTCQQFCSDAKQHTHFFFTNVTKGLKLTLILKFPRNLQNLAFSGQGTKPNAEKLGPLWWTCTQMSLIQICNTLCQAAIDQLTASCKLTSNIDLRNDDKATMTTKCATTTNWQWQTF